MIRTLPIFFALILIGAGCVEGTPRFAPTDDSQQEVVESDAPEVDDVSDLTGTLDEVSLEELGLTTPEKTPIMHTEFPGVLPDAELLNKKATITTSKGVIELDLFGDTAPMATSNFITLSKEGYYDGLTFHRRVEGFVIQGGDPDGTGSGGPGYRFEDELTDDYAYDRGILAMANAGPNTNGSQFFIMLADNPLPKAYTIFGRVTSGMDAVDAIKIGDTMTTIEIK